MTKIEFDPVEQTFNDFCLLKEKMDKENIAVDDEVLRQLINEIGTYRRTFIIQDGNTNGSKSVKGGSGGSGSSGSSGRGNGSGNNPATPKQYKFITELHANKFLYDHDFEQITGKSTYDESIAFDHAKQLISRGIERKNSK